MVLLASVLLGGVWGLLPDLAPAGPVGAEPVSRPVQRAAPPPDPLASEAEPPPAPRQVRVPGDRRWMNTGVEVGVGDTVELLAAGVVFHNPREAVGPDGTAAPRGRGSDVLPDVGHGALIARVGEGGTPFVVGATTTFEAARAGVLHLGVNDLGVANNAGGFDVAIRHTGAADATDR